MEVLIERLIATWGGKTEAELAAKMMRAAQSISGVAQFFLSFRV